MCCHEAATGRIFVGKGIKKERERKRGREREERRLTVSSRCSRARDEIDIDTSLNDVRAKMREHSLPFCLHLASPPPPYSPMTVSSRRRHGDPTTRMARNKRRKKKKKMKGKLQRFEGEVKEKEEEKEEKEEEEEEEEEEWGKIQYRRRDKQGWRWIQPWTGSETSPLPPPPLPLPSSLLPPPFCESSFFPPLAYLDPRRSRRSIVRYTRSAAEYS